MKISKVITGFCLIVMISIITSFSCLAAEMEFPYEYGPGFFAEFKQYTTNDVIRSEDGRLIIGIKENMPTDCNVVEVVQEQVYEPEIQMVEPLAIIPGDNRWGISLNENELDTLAKIVDLECGNQCDLGQQAVIEVIFNRVKYDGFNNDVVGVLSEKGQFSTWKYVHKGTPDARIYANINAVLNGQTNIFPSNTVFFSRKAQNKRVQAVIQDHVFCNA